MAGEIRAAGVCYEVHVPTDDGTITDAIAVSLEDMLGGNALVFMPYTRGGRLTGVKFDEITVSPGEPRVFVPACDADPLRVRSGLLRRPPTLARPAPPRGSRWPTRPPRPRRPGSAP